jgi:AraC-like DNA-binding protein
MISKRHDLPEMPRGTAQTPIALVRAIVLGYQRYGTDPANALAHAGIAAGSLLDPALRVTAVQMEALSCYAMQELDDEALGWFRRRLPWGSYGLLCRGSFTAPDLGIALKRWCRHHRVLTEDVSLQLSVSQGEACLRIVEHVELGALREFCLISLLRYLLGFACWVVDSRLPLRRAQFPFAEPAHAGVYPQLFGGQLQFGADCAAVCFDARYLALAPQRDEAALRAMLQRALPLTVRQYQRDRLLCNRVGQFLRSASGVGATAAQLAARFNVSTRTFHRQLAEEGQSLQGLKDVARHERACQLLARSARPIKQVAGLAGFANEKSFARAFRGWTGETPSAYRARARGPAR